MLAVISNQHLTKNNIRRKAGKCKTAHSSPPDYETRNIVSTSDGVSCAENDELDKLMQKPDFIYSDLPYSLYRYGKTYEMKMKTAFEMYKMNQDENLKKYIKRTGKKIAANLLKNEEYKDFSELLTWGLVSKPALKELLETVRETGHPEVEASILEAIGQQHIAKNKFSL